MTLKYGLPRHKGCSEVMVFRSFTYVETVIYGMVEGSRVTVFYFLSQDFFTYNEVIDSRSMGKLDCLEKMTNFRQFSRQTISLLEYVVKENQI